MGIKATVVYDVQRHKALVLRTQSVSITERYAVLDTIASFSQHCESLRGMARTATEVSAAWGGPPYVTYAVIASRFRTIVIWDESAAEFDLAYDVHHCLSRLERIVTDVAEQLKERSGEAVARVYEEAGYALRGEAAIGMGEVVRKASRPKLLPKSPSSKRSSFAEPRKKKSGTLFGKISNALKKGTSKDGSEESFVNSERPLASRRASESSLRPPSEAAAASVANYGSDVDSPFDDEIGELQLSDAVFEWANFGGDVQDETGDLGWFIALVHGDETVKKSKPPLLRGGSVTSTPLTIPSVATPLSSGGGSGQSSVEKGQPLPLPAPSGATGVMSPSNASGSAKAAKSQADKQSGTANAAAVVSPPQQKQPAVQAQALPAVQQATPVSRAVPVVPQGGVSVPQAGSASQAPGVPQPASISQPARIPQAVSSPQAMGVPQALSLSQGGANVQNAAAVQQGMSPMMQPQIAQQRMQSAAVPAASLPNQGVTGMLAQHGVNGGTAVQPAVLQPQNVGAAAVSVPSGPPSVVSSRGSVPSVQTPMTGRSTPQMQTSSVGSNIPPALAAQMKADNEFDLAVLGDYKDDATASAQGPSSSGSMVSQSKDDEAIRARMNEFAVTMQAGNFTLALQQVLATLKLLRQVQPRRERETMTCANYVLAQKILIRNQALETEVGRFPNGSAEAVRRHVEMALLTMFLAELKHLLPRHRVAAMKVAVEKNVAVGNFGMCARWLRVLVDKAPPNQKGEFQRRLEVCVRNGERNAQMPMTNRLCYITLQVLTSPYGKCTVCSAVYHPQMAGVVAGQICPTCFVGAVEGMM